MGTRLPRVAATIQLTQDDADLIRWLSGLPAGERNRRMKDALRAGLRMPVRKQAELEQATGSEIEALKAQIARMQEQLDQLPRLIAANAHLSATVDQGERIDPETLAKRAERHKKAKW